MFPEMKELSMAVRRRIYRVHADHMWFEDPDKVGKPIHRKMVEKKIRK